MSINLPTVDRAGEWRWKITSDWTEKNSKYAYLRLQKKGWLFWHTEYKRMFTFAGEHPDDVNAEARKILIHLNATKPVWLDQTFKA